MFSHGKATVDWDTMLSGVSLSLISTSFYFGGKFYQEKKSNLIENQFPLKYCVS